jgi:hypothetical protein
VLGIIIILREEATKNPGGNVNNPHPDILLGVYPERSVRAQDDIMIM